VAKQLTDKLAALMLVVIKSIPGTHILILSRHTSIQFWHHFWHHYFASFHRVF